MLAHIPYMKHITSDIMEFHAKVSKVVVSNPDHPSSIENYGDLGDPLFSKPPIRFHFRYYGIVPPVSHWNWRTNSSLRLNQELREKVPKQNRKHGPKLAKSHVFPMSHG